MRFDMFNTPFAKFGRQKFAEVQRDLDKTWMLDVDGDGEITVDELRAQGRDKFITAQETKNLEAYFEVGAGFAHRQLRRMIEKKGGPQGLNKAHFWAHQTDFFDHGRT